jgi:hypothetical protein
MLQNTNSIVGILFHVVKKQRACCFLKAGHSGGVDAFGKNLELPSNRQNACLDEKTLKIQAGAE